MRERDPSGFYSQSADGVLAALSLLSDPNGPARLRNVAASKLALHPYREPDPDGLWSEVFFGPRGQRDPSRWATLVLPIPLLHPALAARIGAVLQWTADEVLAVARFEAWVAAGKVRFPVEGPGTELRVSLFDWPPHLGGDDLGPPNSEPHERANVRFLTELGIDPSRLDPNESAFERALSPHSGPEAIGIALMAAGRDPADYLVRWVPVPPLGPGDEPFLRGGGVGIDPRRKALRNLLLQRDRTGRLLEVEVPALFVASSCLQLQLAFEAVVTDPRGASSVGAPRAARSAESPSRPDSPRFVDPSTSSEEFGEVAVELPLKRVRGLALSETGSVHVAFGAATVDVGPEGRVIGWHPNFGLEPLAAKSGLVLYGSPLRHTWVAFDLRARAWKRGPSHNVIPFGIDEVVEEVWLTRADKPSRVRLHEVVGYLDSLRLTPEADAFYARDREGRGGLYAADGSLLFELDSEVVGDDDDSDVLAIAFHAKRRVWRLLLASGRLIDGWTSSTRVSRHTLEAAAFASDGGQTVLAERGALSMSGGRFDLAPLYPALFGPPRAKPHEVAAIVSRFGAVVALKSVTAEDLANVSVESPRTGTTKPLGLRRAAEWKAIAEATSLPEELPQKIS